MALEQQSTITEEWYDCHSKKMLNDPTTTTKFSLFSPLATVCHRKEHSCRAWEALWIVLTYSSTSVLT